MKNADSFTFQQYFQLNPRTYKSYSEFQSTMSIAIAIAIGLHFFDSQRDVVILIA